MKVSEKLVCQLTATQVRTVLNWFYSYSFTVSDRSKQVANLLSGCIGEEL